ncbi:hypothetical protein DMUE_5004 [Dictyocoela muelleri]|nr:hypothetical protein DMUE_5004 [Dictyocoela muelleri]
MEQVFNKFFRSYFKIDQSVYNHENVNNSENFVHPFTGVHTKTIEANWSAIKRNPPKEARCESKIDLYLVRLMIVRNFGDDYTIKSLQILFIKLNLNFFFL